MAQAPQRCCQGKGENPFTIICIAPLVFLPLLTTLAEELYLASEMPCFKHKSKPPCTCRPPKAPRGYAHGSNKIMSFAELGLQNWHHYGLLSLVRNIRCFYQKTKPISVLAFQLKMQGLLPAALKLLWAQNHLTQVFKHCGKSAH